MNIFVILIMAVMLASYQYFTEKRTTGTALNKNELQLQARLSCLKQFHDYASAINETVATDTVADIREEIKYNCLGEDDIRVYKYCINSSGAKTDCSDENTHEHCVSSSEWIIFSKKDLYMTTQIPKNGITIIHLDEKEEKPPKIKGKEVIVNKTKPTGEYPTLVGLVSCVSAEKIDKLNKISETLCEAGQVAITKDDGTYECQNMVTGNICTAHETKVDTKPATNNDKCTEISDSICCAKDSSIISCEKGKNPVWDYNTRYWICSDGDEYCSADGSMSVTDDRGTPYAKSTVTIPSPAWTPQYNERTKQFFCYPKSNLFTTACKDLIKDNRDYAYLNVTGLSQPVEGTKVQSQNYTSPYTCVLSYKKNSNAVENCTPCEQVVFDYTNNRWTCKAFPNYTELQSIGLSAMEELKSTNRKGIKGCFSDCTSNMWSKIKSGIYNEKDWGLTYDTTTRMWNCFSCDSSSTYNNACEATITKSHDCSSQSTVNIGVCHNDRFGKCYPKSCSTEYQVLIDDVCYTKWCSRSILPENVEINTPTSSCCPDSSPWMLYNEEKTCVYCVRPPSQRIR